MTTPTQWTVPENHPAFAGHFPGNPILPGVVLLDLALHIITESGGAALDRCEVSSVKFLSPAKPGDELLVRHERSGSGVIQFEIVAGSRKIVIGSVTRRLSE